MKFSILTHTHFMQLVDRLVTDSQPSQHHKAFHESGLMQHEAHTIRGQLSRIDQLGYSKKLIKPGLLESSNNYNELYTRETSLISLISGQGSLACALITVYLLIYRTLLITPDTLLGNFCCSNTTDTLHLF